MNNPLTPPPSFAASAAPSNPVAGTPHPGAQPVMAAPLPGANAPSPSAPQLNPAQVATPPTMEQIPQAVTELPDLSHITDIDVSDLNDVFIRDFTKFESKLEVRDPQAGLDYRWINNNPHRVQKLYREGWRLVKNPDKALNEIENSDTPMLRSGDVGNTMVLVARPTFFKEQRDKSYRRLMEENQRSLDPKHYAGNNGTTDAQSYQAQMRVGWSSEG